jgi:recombination protein RecT
MPELVSLAKKAETVRSLLEKSRAQIALALPRHLTADRMLRVVMTSVRQNPALLECEPISLLGAVIQSSQLGLEPDGVLGQAYLIPYRNKKRGVREVQFQPGYKGLLELARRSGELSSVETRVVHNGDHFRYQFGLAPILEHIPRAEGWGESNELGAPTFVYAIIRLRDGAVQWDVMSAREVESHRQRYSHASDDGPWATAWEEMARKTVLKRVLKLAPASVEVHRAIALDEHAEAGLPQELEAVALTAGVAPPENSTRSTLEKITDEISEKTDGPPTPPHETPVTTTGASATISFTPPAPARVSPVTGAPTWAPPYDAVPEPELAAEDATWAAISSGSQDLPGVSPVTTARESLTTHDEPMACIHGVPLGRMCPACETSAKTPRPAAPTPPPFEPTLERSVTIQKIKNAADALELTEGERKALWKDIVGDIEQKKASLEQLGDVLSWLEAKCKALGIELGGPR